VIYIMIGWNQKGGFFKPAQIMRSILDSQTDDSTLWRDIENFDLVSTVQQFPFIGTGYGHPYIEVIPLPAVDYPLEFYIPHNSLIGLWAYCGYFGFTALTLIFAGGVFVAMRGYYAAARPADRAAAITALGAIVIYLVQVYGDVGLGAWAGVFTVAPALAIAGKIAVATGGWPSAASRRDRSPPPKNVVVEVSPLPSG
jgi:O-antigen ligase